jgi:carbamoyl-phosphate synthase large subunit
MKFYNILVTGCGGDIAQSMGKILIGYPKTGKVIGCDIHSDHAGHFIFHECFVVERVSSLGYNDSIVTLVNQQNIDIIIPATEYELEYLLSNDLRGIGRCIIIKPNNLAVEIGLDKYRTAKFLESNDLPFPRTVLLEEATGFVLPCIVKSRRGSGSKTVHIVKDSDTFMLLAKVLKDALCQEYLDAAGEEFTCAVYRSSLGIIRMIQFRRKLTGGYSSFGIVEKNKTIELILEKLASLINLVGSINVQLRLQDGVPKIFEINARFSSTVLFRHLLGFEDLIWSIEDALGLEIGSYFEPPLGSKFYKGFQEYIVKAERI